jgi:hypothetical protein
MTLKSSPFIKGFSRALGIGVDEAVDLWKEFSRAIPKKDRKRLERSDENDGYMQGLAYKQWENK